MEADPEAAVEGEEAWAVSREADCKLIVVISCTYLIMITAIQNDNMYNMYINIYHLTVWSGIIVRMAIGGIWSLHFRYMGPSIRNDETNCQGEAETGERHRPWG